VSLKVISTAANTVKGTKRKAITVKKEYIFFIVKAVYIISFKVIMVDL
jgi:hypothetical protein